MAFAVDLFFVVLAQNTGQWTNFKPGIGQGTNCVSDDHGMVFLGKTYDVSPYDSQRSHPSIDLGVKWDLCVLFVQTAVNCQDCKFV